MNKPNGEGKGVEEILKNYTLSHKIPEGRIVVPQRSIWTARDKILELITQARQEERREIKRELPVKRGATTHRYRINISMYNKGWNKYRDKVIEILKERGL